ncbi:MAG: winged helix-turn-helix transcriptional regulator [Candidatus Hodarchaeales archaeon]|jgi:Lrp/AsnC family leucine-responsive transcriptional regulator
MDGIDRKIMLDLSNNCRTTYQEMAQKHNVSANAIKKRVTKLLSMGVIQGFHVELSYAMVDGEACMVLVTTDGTEDESFIEMIGNSPYVGVVGKLAGSTYNLIAVYQGGSTLLEIGSMLRNISCVTNVEVHPIIFDKGKKVEFSFTDKKVLQYLVSDPRMTISEIAKKSGLTSRTVRKTIIELYKSSGVTFGIYMNPTAGSGITPMFRLHWKEKETNIGEILSYLSQTYPDEYFVPMLSATNPLLFAIFFISDSRRLKEINNLLRQKTEFTSIITYLGEPARFFPDLKLIKLREILAEAGLPSK